jgi:hypothetical protein
MAGPPYRQRGGGERSSAGRTTVLRAAPAHLRAIAMSSPAPPPSPKSPPDGPPPIAVSPHILTWWFAAMAIGGVGFGLVADKRPFGPGIVAYPLVVFFACVAAILLTLRFIYAKPLREVISIPSLVAGFVIAAVCFAIGDWFGVSLMRMP